MEILSTAVPTPSPTLRPRRTAERILLAVAIAAFAAGVLIGVNPAFENAGIVLRWLGIALVVPVAVWRRSLLVWTFLAMLAGAVLGADAPHAAGQMKFIGDIF